MAARGREVVSIFGASSYQMAARKALLDLGRLCSLACKAVSAASGGPVRKGWRCEPAPGGPMSIMRTSSVEGKEPVVRCSRRFMRESRLEMTSLSCLSSSSTKPMAADLVGRGAIGARMNSMRGVAVLGQSAQPSRLLVGRWAEGGRPYWGEEEEGKGCVAEEDRDEEEKEATAA